MEAVTLACVLIIFIIMTAYFVRVMMTLDDIKDNIVDLRSKLCKVERDIDYVDDHLMAFWDWCDDDVIDGINEED